MNEIHKNLLLKLLDNSNFSDKETDLLYRFIINRLKVDNEIDSILSGFFETEEGYWEEMQDSIDKSRLELIDRFGVKKGEEQ